MSEFAQPRALGEEQLTEFAVAAGAQAATNSGRYLFEHEVTASPCRFPCDIPEHVHQWPAAFLQRIALDPEEIIDYTGGS